MPFITSVRGTYSSLTGRTGRVGLNLAGITATGASTSEPGNGYRYQTYTSPGTFDTTGAGGVVLVDYLIVGGGGGGGGELSDQYNAGGGGGGGVLQASGASIAAGSYGITVGDGGAYFSKPGVYIGQNGGNSSFGPALIAYGGGGGGVDAAGGSVYGTPQGPNGWNGQPGGSGGGGGSYSASADGPGGTGVSGQGYPGGTGGPGSGFPSGGGGGAGGSGFPGGGGNYGEGGDSVSWPGNSTRYGGGGGGGATDVTPHAGASGKDSGGVQNNPRGGGGYGFTGGDGFNPNYPARVGSLSPVNPGSNAWNTGYAGSYQPWAVINGQLANQGMGGGGAGRIPGTIGEGCPGSPGVVIIRYSLSQ